MPLIRRLGFLVLLAIVTVILFYRPSIVSEWYDAHHGLEKPLRPQTRPPKIVDQVHKVLPEGAELPPTSSPVFLSATSTSSTSSSSSSTSSSTSVATTSSSGSTHWHQHAEKYPVTSPLSLPTGNPARIPRIQYGFHSEDREAGIIREERLQTVKKCFMRSWNSYKEHAWLRDELAPISGGQRDTFGGWAATLVDTLDTLMILGLTAEFDEAVQALDKIDFTTTEEATVNVFETTIRYLGGLLSAHDLSDGRHAIILRKAKEIGDILYSAFDTPNRMPVTRWDWKAYANGDAQEASSMALIAELGSLTVEFTRLSQLTNDSKYYDAVQRITDKLEKGINSTKLPGLFPVVANATGPTFSEDNTFTLGGMADSLYEYFPKQYMLLGGLSDQYRRLYEASIDAAKEHVFFRPMTNDSRKVLLSGDARVASDGHVSLIPRAQHLACFAGGMVAIGAKIFNRPDDLQVAQELVDGCVWAYEIHATGIMPEIFFAMPCKAKGDCSWDVKQWYQAIADRRKVDDAKHAADMADDLVENVIEQQRLVPGVVAYESRKYILRPEAVESLFILYRITGNSSLQDTAWRMFTSIERWTATKLANAAIDDVTTTNPAPRKFDQMESFWLAETLKYFYLIFSEPELISLDEYVFNTEAHPMKRPRPEW